MSVETATYISQLNPSSPAAGDLKSEGDDHMRLTKSVLQNQFPNLGATAVTATAAELNAVTAGLAQKANKAGDTYTGAHDLTGATVNVATQSATDNTTKAASTAQVQAAIMASSGVSAQLPGQTGNTGKYLTTDGSVASWGAVTTPGLVLLATLTPTAAANVDFLSAFSSTYDNYLIIGNGIKPDSDDALRMRFATSGSADAGSNYYPRNLMDGAAVTVSTTSAQITATITSAGTGCGFCINVQNANNATNAKTEQHTSAYQTNATPGYFINGGGSVYSAANAISGVRFFFSSGSNFSATGNIRVYGYSNT